MRATMIEYIPYAHSVINICLIDSVVCNVGWFHLDYGNFLSCGFLSRFAICACITYTNTWAFLRNTLTQIHPRVTLQTLFQFSWVWTCKATFKKIHVTVSVLDMGVKGGEYFKITVCPAPRTWMRWDPGRGLITSDPYPSYCVIQLLK